MTTKVERDGMVGVLVSRGYGAGWTSWNYEYPFLLHGDERLIELVEKGDLIGAEEYTKSVVGEDAYLGGVDGLYVHWIPKGTMFIIDEYDGAETLMTMDDFVWKVA